ncbi:hypothetical protein VTJ83DRAFT_6774 [Remersonia thermophila]|uniref:Uncharacterized protein n=1 Tax=Remersonia thermophila TaxID=72144 RepID=A0ABR4D5N6_9PEZI
MRLPTLLPALLAAAAAPLASASDDASQPFTVVGIYIQPVAADSARAAPSLLAEIALPSSDDRDADSDAAAAAGGLVPAEVVNYASPDLPDGDDKLVRVGVYDAARSRWVSSTSVAAVGNFAKGYAPHFVITLDDDDDDNDDDGTPQSRGEKTKSKNKEEKRSSTAPNVLGVTVRGVAIDAGVTRDFGPQAVVARTKPGVQPTPGKPIVLSPEGKKMVEQGERTFLQKYWWAIAIAAFLVLGGGGEGGQ